MRKDVEAFVAKAEAAQNADDKFFAYTGLYSLEKSLKEYGEKYAVNTKVNAIIEHLKLLYENIRKIIEPVKIRSDENLISIQKDFETKKFAVVQVIQKVKEKYSFDKKYDAERLGIDGNTLEIATTKKVQEVFMTHFTIFADVFGAEVNKGLEEIISQALDDIFNDLCESYYERRQNYLLEIQNDFICDIIESIQTDETISQEIKNNLQSFPTPSLPQDFNLKEKFEISLEASRTNDFKFIKLLVAGLEKSLQNNDEKKADTEESIPEPENIHQENSNEKTEAQSFADFSFEKINLAFKDFFELAKEVGDQVSKNIVEGTRKVAKDLNARVSNFISKSKVENEIQKYVEDKKDDLITSFKGDFTTAFHQVINDVYNSVEENIENFSSDLSALKNDRKAVEQVSEILGELEKKLEDKKARLYKKI